MSVAEVYKDLRDLKQQELQAIARGDSEETDRLHELIAEKKKTKVRACTSLGIFDGPHQKKFFVEKSYTGYIPVDIDNPTDREKSIEQLKKLPGMTVLLA